MVHSWQHKVLRVASRTSNLAVKQVEEVFKEYPGLHYQMIPIQSFGDKHKSISLIDNPIQDFFTRELDEAIIRNEADIAIHSAKDLPYPIPEPLEILALFAAFDQTDAIVSRHDQKLAELCDSPRVGTSSPLRKAELLKIRSDIRIVSLRGTIEERIRQIDEGSLDAAVIATCALKRLGLTERIAEVLQCETHPLQGHLAVVAKKRNQELLELFMDKDIRKNYGKVWLIGFGPGDPGLLTIKGLEQLQQADVIYYDDLINHDFLNKFRAECIYVGKRNGHHSHSQGEINRLLYNSAIVGKNVVRLKGGDPMLFAHGGEELDYLDKNFVDTEVIPGITTALAASAYTKIPLTHRNISSSVTFLTGHSLQDLTIPDSGTLVIYMGASNFTEIAQMIIQKGWQPVTPVMMVTRVSETNQNEYLTTLGEASHNTQNYPTPLIIIIGDVIRQNRKLTGNLERSTFLVTGTNPQEFFKYGRVQHSPFIKLSPLEDYGHLKNMFDALHCFHWLIFTSRFAVQYFFKALYHCKRDSRYLAGLRITSIGTSTSAELSKYGIVPDLQSSSSSSFGLIELFKDHKISGQQVLIPRSDKALSLLPDGLKNIGNNVTLVTVYRNEAPEKVSTIVQGEFDYIVFNSPSGVENFFNTHQCQQFNHQKFIVQGIVTMRKLKNYQILDMNMITIEMFEKEHTHSYDLTKMEYETIS